MNNDNKTRKISIIMKDSSLNEVPFPTSSISSSSSITPPTTTKTSPILENLSNIPPYMLRKSSKKLLDKSTIPLPTKKLRMKSFLWIKPYATSKGSICTDSSSSILAQLLPTLLVNLAALSTGLSFGFSAIVLPQLESSSPFYSSNKNETEPINLINIFSITKEEASWIASIFGLGAILGGFCAAFLGSRFGRRKTLFLLALTDTLGWLLITTSQSVIMMLFGRFLNGFSAAGYCPSIQIYVSEIAQLQHRGWLCAITVPMIGFGSLLVYILGAIIHWQYVAIVGILIPACLSLGLIWLPDSPYWYLQNSNEKKALKVMERFRSKNSNGISELLNISESLNLDAMEFDWKQSFRHFLRRQYRRPFFLLNFLFLLMAFSGNYAISFYAVDIFKTWHHVFDEYLATIVMGSIKLLGSLLYIPAIKYFQRRTLLCATSVIMGVSLCVLAASLYSSSPLTWLPIACVIVYMLVDPMGLGSIPYLYTAEFYASEMRSTLSGITVGLVNLELFIVVKTFPTLSYAMGGLHAVFLFYGVVCFAAFVYVIAFIPETKNRSLQDIETHFGRKESLHVTPLHTPAGTPSLVKRGLAPYPQLSLQFTL